MRFHRQHDRHQDVADNGDHQIGREVVGAMVVQFLAAMRTGVAHLQEFVKHAALAAGRTAAAESAPYRLAEAFGQDASDDG
jgi:hypothetical protein